MTDLSTKPDMLRILSPNLRKLLAKARSLYQRFVFCNSKYLARICLPELGILNVLNGAAATGKSLEGQARTQFVNSRDHQRTGTRWTFNPPVVGKLYYNLCDFGLFSAVGALYTPFYDSAFSQ